MGTEKKDRPFGTHWQSMLFMPSSNRLSLLSNAYDGITWDGYVSKLDEKMLVVQKDNPGLGGGSLLVSTPVDGDDEGITGAFDRGYLVTYDSRLNEKSKLPVHEGIITGMVPGNGGRFVTTCSTDQSISQVDLNTGATRKRIGTAHLSHVLSIDALPSNDSNLFITCGKDKEIVTWDLRDRLSGSYYAYCNSCPSAVQYCERDEQYFVVGTYDSHLMLFDTRNNRTEVQSRSMECKRITKIRRIPIPAAAAAAGVTCGLMAVMSDHNVVSIVKELSLGSVYQGSSIHTGIITDLQVIRGEVFTIGHGIQHLVQHTLP